MDISVTVCLCICTVMDFSAEDKGSGVKFFLAVHRRSRQGISHFCELCSPRGPKLDESVSTRATPIAHPHVIVTIEMRRHKRHAGDAPLVKFDVWIYVSPTDMRSCKTCSLFYTV